MAPPVTLTSRLKVQLKLSISRLRMVQQKDTALSKQQRRAMAQLIEQGKLESARIRVENIIRSDITSELHEILELYCELLLARIQLLDPPPGTVLAHPSSSSSPGSPGAAQIYCDPGLEEPVRSLIHAAPRTEVKELHAVRNLLVEKFGKEFSVSAMEGQGVAERVMRKLRVETPAPELVDAYLREICRTYGVPFPGDEEVEAEVDEEDDEDDGDGGGLKETQGTEKQLEEPLEAEPKALAKPMAKAKAKALPTEDDPKKAEEVDALRKATAPKAIGPSSPLRVVPPSPSSENVTPRVKMPGAAMAAAKKEPVKKKEDASGPGGKIPDVDELARRFAALKR